MPIISNECFSKDRKLCKSLKCFDKKAILRWSVQTEEFSLIFSFLAYWSHIHIHIQSLLLRDDQSR